jgi:hypothetical protein
VIQNEIINNGYCLVRLNSNIGLVDAVSEIQNSFNSILKRDVVINSSPTEGELGANTEDFWCHTDGVFINTPPSYVLIQVIEADAGGELCLLDTAHISHVFSKEEFFFGKDENGVKSKIVSYDENSQKTIFRYREDYMASLQPNSTLFNENRKITDYVAKAELKIGKLMPGEFLIIDNWRMLHRRRSFTGKRTIRRLWFFQSHSKKNSL